MRAGRASGALALAAFLTIASAPMAAGAVTPAFAAPAFTAPAFAAPASAPARCPPWTEALIASGWKAYRSDSLLAAHDRFLRATRICPADLDGVVGLAYSNLRLGYLMRAESLFTAVTATDPANTDGWDGLMSSAYRLGDYTVAMTAAKRSWALHQYPDAKLILDRIYPGWDRPMRPRAPRPDSLVVPARAANERFEVRTVGGWAPLYVKGMNLGAALPGSFPSEFPRDSTRYADWLADIAAMNANAVRVYTLHPPEFYRALRAWNDAHPAHPLWLIQGVWAEPPPRDDFRDRAWLAALQGEMRGVVDAVHGEAGILARPGHAGGRFDADVSRWTLAWIFGREWEPSAVKGFDARNPGRHMHAGRYLALADGSAMEAWLAERCDELLAYEVGRYRALHPIAYVSWPTLDPLRHPTEADHAEEKAWRARVGRPAVPLRAEYENDAVSIDASRVRATDENPAGWFASYHAYPYYPDFMSYDSGYNRARGREGRSNYFGYLSDLRRHHAGLPVLIAEYGLPSSRGLAHYQPQGWSHGGLDEADAAAGDARLTREIRESGCAGGVLFEWMDEWFKRNWAVMDLEEPAERTRMWHNAMDPEQNFGVLAMHAGAEGAAPVLGGDLSRWRALPVVQAVGAGASPARGAPITLRVGSDESYVYLALELAGLRGRSLESDSLRVWIALDTDGAASGQTALPGGLGRGDLGFEYLARLDGARSRLLAAPGVDPYIGPRDYTHGDDRGRFFRAPGPPGLLADGRFDPMFVVVNRARFGRDGTFFPARPWERGRLQYGTERRSTLSDWYYDSSAGLIELRLPWALLGVTDPSSLSMLGRGPVGDEFSFATAEGFRFGVVTSRGSAAPQRVGALPALSAGGRWKASEFATWTWGGWESPTWHARHKPAYEAMRAVWGSMPDELATDGSAR